MCDLHIYIERERESEDSRVGDRGVGPAPEETPRDSPTHNGEPFNVFLQNKIFPPCPAHFRKSDLRNPGAQGFQEARHHTGTARQENML